MSVVSRYFLAVIAVFLLTGAAGYADASENDDWNAIEEESWTLKYKVQNDKLFVECVLPSFSLQPQNKGGDGYLAVEVNRTRAAEMNKAAFVMKGLPSEKYEISVTPVSYEEEFEENSITFTAGEKEK
ncbi:hypothetical protein [Alteribacillus sp. HJP-4]|uniref:hypothetical protein n=1 Tax=Alteribacillus sp. HJP-4 TaxID=2775394 RepID=UPI0035CCC8CF